MALWLWLLTVLTGHIGQNHNLEGMQPQNSKISANSSSGVRYSCSQDQLSHPRRGTPDVMWSLNTRGQQESSLDLEALGQAASPRRHVVATLQP